MSHQKKEALWLVARIIIGGIFITTGWMKVSNMTITLGFFHSMGISSLVTYIVSYAEIICGAMVLFGVYTCKAAGALFIIMLGAVYYTFGSGFQVYAWPLTLIASLLMIVSVGSGKHALRRD